MNHEYWKKYYKEAYMKPPSPFAEFCFGTDPKHKLNARVLEIAAGDGRDTNLIKDCVDYVYVVEPNNDLTHLGVEQYQGSFEKYLSFSARGDFDVIYARWFIHAVSEEVEDKLLKYAHKINAYLALEFRIEGDTPDDSHERRLINLEKFIDKAATYNLKVIHKESGHGLSVFGNDDPLLARLILQPHE